MNRFDRCAVSVALASTLFVSVAHAQYTADFQTNIISGVTSNWTGGYYIGSNTFADALLVQGGGVLTSGTGYLGYEDGGSNSFVLVTDSGSVWSNSYLYVGRWNGQNVAGNSLVISNSGQVVSGGVSVYSSSNSFLVCGTGSVWNVGNGALNIYGDGISLIISNGGRLVALGTSTDGNSNSIVATGPGTVCSGFGLGGDGNRLLVSAGAFVGGVSMDGWSNTTALVTDAGTIVSNKFGIMIGDYGRGNCLVISNGARLISQGGTLAQDNASPNNSVVLIGSGSVWSNSADLRVGDYGKSNGLVVDSGARVFNNYAYIGYRSGADKNVVFIGGSGSIWSNRNDLYIGGGPGNNVGNSVGNWLVISNGGKVYSGASFVGYNSTASNNSAVITGNGSLWTNRNSLLVGISGSSNSLTVGNQGKVANAGDLCIGRDGLSNSMVISSSGMVLNAFGYIGSNQTSSGNSVTVSGIGSVWSNRSDLYVGNLGSSNSLVIAGGGHVFGNYGYVGYSSSTSTSANNSVQVVGTGSVWSNLNDLYVGYWYGGGNSLIVSNGGFVRSRSGYVGGPFGSSNNSLVVTGTGSVWRTAFELDLGYGTASNSFLISEGGNVLSSSIYFGRSSSNTMLVTGADSVCRSFNEFDVGRVSSDNSLVISNGGKVLVDFAGYVGNQGRSNYVLVTGTGSMWSNGYALYVGESNLNGDNRLVIRDGGRVLDSYGYVGFTSSSNGVRVEDGAVWQNNDLSVGYWGSNNTLLVTGGMVLATNLVVGTYPVGCDNLVQLDSGSILVTNATGDAVLEVRNGQLALNGGLLQADILVMTNSCARFIRTGGTLIVSNLVLDVNMDADGDGIPNGWEQAYGLDPLNAVDASADNDGDGMSNLQEYLAGTDPTNSASAFRILSIVPTNDDMLVSWTAGGGRTNVVQSATDLASSYTNVSPNIILPGSGDVTTNYLDAGAGTNSTARFYRIRLVP